MATITKDANCLTPGCDTILEVEFDPNGAEQEVSCEECGHTYLIDYDKTAGTVELLDVDEIEEDEEDDESPDEEAEEEKEEAEEEAEETEK